MKNAAHDGQEPSLEELASALEELSRALESDMAQVRGSLSYLAHQLEKREH
jgi:predicted transcriptional regulator with HTH domain